MTSNLSERLAAIAMLQAKIKQTAMTYQRLAKEVVAKHYGLPFADVDLRFLDWMKLRERYERETGRPL